MTMFSEETKKHEEALQRAAAETRARYCASWTVAPTEEAQCTLWAEAIRPLFETAQKRLSTLDHLRYALSELLKEAGESPDHDIAKILLQVMTVMRRAKRPMTETEARERGDAFVARWQYDRNLHVGSKLAKPDLDALAEQHAAALLNCSRGEVVLVLEGGAPAKMAVTDGGDS